jgi:hypothetical protein
MVLIQTTSFLQPFQVQRGITCTQQVMAKHPEHCPSWMFSWHGISLPLVALILGLRALSDSAPLGKSKFSMKCFPWLRNLCTLWLIGETFKGGEVRMPNSSFANLSNMLLHGLVLESLNMSNREAKISQVLGQFSILKGQ